MSQPEPTPPVLKGVPIDYERTSADDEHLGRYLRMILGGSALLYGGFSVVTAAIFYATMYGLIDTEMTYDSTYSNLARGADLACAAALLVVGPLILWGRRHHVAAACRGALLAAGLMLIVFVLDWAWSLGVARHESPDLDAWYWIAAFTGTAAYAVIPLMIGLLAREPCLSRICAATRV